MTAPSTPSDKKIEHKFTVPEEAYYQFTLTFKGKTYTQTVVGKSLEDAQTKIKAEMWTLV